MENYADSEFVTEKIPEILLDSFRSDQSEDPVEYASDIMKTLVNFEQAKDMNDLYDRLVSEAEGAVKNVSDDKTEDNRKDIESKINQLKALRIGIKYAADKYPDYDTHNTLGGIFRIVLERLEYMENVREHLGWTSPGYAKSAAM